MAYTAMTYIVMTYTVIAYMLMGYIVMACKDTCDICGRDGIRVRHLCRDGNQGSLCRARVENAMPVAHL